MQSKDLASQTHSSNVDNPALGRDVPKSQGGPATLTAHRSQATTGRSSRTGWGSPRRASRDACSGIGRAICCRARKECALLEMSSDDALVTAKAVRSNDSKWQALRVF